MEPIKRFWRDLPLRKTLVVYITAAALLALALCGITNDLCSLGIRKIHAGYLDTMEKYYLTNERGERLGEGAYIGTDAIPLSPEDQGTVDLLRALPTVTTPVWSALCILGAALLFYQDKLKRPLAELRQASEKISQNDLDFTVTVYGGDELGQPSASFETMRAALARNFSEMWRQMEERKRLNAAFAHDLRTPLTVLKGYNEMLQASGEQETQATAVTMGRHIARLEQYVSTMSQLRRLEDTRPSPQPTALASLATSLAESGGMVCAQAGKDFLLDNQTASPELSLDGAFVAQVFGNLVANAARYAKNTVTLTLAETGDGLLLTVADDGPGFTPEALEKAADPYFTGEKGSHFGLGLYICKMLCDRHGGWLKIENGPAGGKVTAFFGTGPEIR